MICRKCGASLPDNAIRCSNCGIKVNMYCPKCKTLNAFGNKNCVNCGAELIKICPVCRSVNIYSAVECRKCKTPFPQTIQENNETNSENYETEVNDSEVIINSVFNETDEIEAENIQDTIIQEEQEPSVILENYTNNSPAQEYISQEPILKANDETTENSEFEYYQETVNTVENEADANETKSDFEEYNEDAQEDSAGINIEESEAEKEEITEETETYQELNNTDDINQPEEPEEQPESYEKYQEEEEPQNAEQSEEFEEYPDEDDEYIEEQESSTAEPSIDGEKTSEPINEVQTEAVKTAVQTIKNSLEKHIIAIKGPEGCGKTTVLKQIIKELTNDGYLGLYGNCTPLSQITSFGYFQDAFLRIMGFPPFINSSELFLKDFKRSKYVKAFSFLNSKELSLFLNILYPAQQDKFENILENRQILFSVIEKVLKSILVNSNIILTIDNFELLDGASYDFIMHLLNNNFFNNRLKLLVAYQEEKPIQSYFEIKDENELKIFETLEIEKLKDEDLVTAANNSLGLNIKELVPAEYLEKILKRADGNALRMEQEIAFLLNIKYISAEENEIYINEENKPLKNPESLEELIKLRLNTIVPGAKNILYMAAIMGYRFAGNILCSSTAIDPNKSMKLLEYLRQELYIKPVDNFTLEFKSLSIWKIIYQEAKNDLLFKENCQRLYQVLKPLILSSNLQKLISCKEALNKQDEFMIWQITAGITSKLGDTNLFVIAQKQSLKVLDEQELDNTDEIRSVIYEQLGKLLSEKSPVEAVTYLSNVLDSHIKAGNINKIIDVGGFFVNSCYLTGNFFGVTEAIDAIISKLQDSSAKINPIDIALIKTRKLKAILNIGNSEQLINIIENEILPEIETESAKKQTDNGYKNILTDAWILSNITLAKAMAMQGNNEVYSVIENIKEYMEKNDIKSEYYKTQTDIIEAFVRSTTGDINTSKEILDEIKEKYNNKIMDSSLLAEWNLISVINRILTNKTKEIKEELFEIAAFTNNINEHLIKNIIKLILGYILQEEGDIKKALDIFNEEITYFAKEKIAIGALLSWALIVKISINSNDIEKALTTATKALEIAQSPKINNYFFAIYFQSYLADIYMIKGDLIAAKMYIEKALMIAKQQNLKYQMIDLYIQYGKYMEEFMSSSQNYSDENINLTSDIYNKGVSLSRELNVQYLIDKSTRERSAFKTYCQLKSINSQQSISSYKNK